MENKEKRMEKAALNRAAEIDCAGFRTIADRLAKYFASLITPIVGDSIASKWSNEIMEAKTLPDKVKAFDLIDEMVADHLPVNIALYKAVFEPESQEPYPGFFDDRFLIIDLAYAAQQAA